MIEFVFSSSMCYFPDALVIALAIDPPVCVASMDARVGLSLLLRPV